jgi:nucleotide-binding universal stress UspA family protein
MAGEIVVGIGGDGSGTAAAHTAARVANMMGVGVVLVFGYESAALGPRGGSLEEEISSIGETATASVKAELLERYPNLTVDVELVPDRPVESLVRVALERGAEAIAVGHGGRGPLRAALLGSVTYEMVHRAPVPILVVPDEDQDETAD